MPKEQRRKPWLELTSIEQNLYLRLLWEDGHTEQAIAHFFETTKGRIVRRRSTLKPPNKDRGTIKKSVDRERFRDLLDLHRMQQMEERGVAAIAPIEEAPGRTCLWPLSTGGRSLKQPKLCGEPAVLGEDLCEDHLAMVRTTRHHRR